MSLIRRLGACVLILALAAAMVFGGHALLQQTMFLLPSHLHVFGVLIVGFGYALLAAIAFLGVGLALEILIRTS